MKKILIELYIPEEYGASELFAPIKDLPYIKKKVRKFIDDNKVKIVE